MTESTPTEGAPELRHLRDVLEQGVPFARESVKAKITSRSGNYGATIHDVHWPPIYIYCTSSVCQGDRFFDCTSEKTTSVGKPDVGRWTPRNLFITYNCRHCGLTAKTYALALYSSSDPKGNTLIQVKKFGEDPPAIGPTPRSLQDLLGEHWPLYLQGRRSELAGLGIGAFIYYRRTVEKIWHATLRRLLQVAQLEAVGDRVAVIESALIESKFTRSMEIAKSAIPRSLYVDGHNPFQALYDACGDAVHEYSDTECLARCTVIRLVLSRFAQRAKEVLSEDSEFRAALGGIASGNSTDA